MGGKALIRWSQYSASIKDHANFCVDENPGKEIIFFFFVFIWYFLPRLEMIWGPLNCFALTPQVSDINYWASLKWLDFVPSGDNFPFILWLRHSAWGLHHGGNVSRIYLHAGF